MKKMIGIVLSVVLSTMLLTACTNANNNSFNMNKDITVVSREDGSGTRGAFIELLGIEAKDANGNKSDLTTEEALIYNSTSGVMTTVAGNSYAIGYISLGSLNSTVKAVKVNGVEATAENIRNQSYTVSRPFNVVLKKDASDLAKDFIQFILSSEGQKVVEQNGYISVAAADSYTSSKLAGKVVVSGSSSVTPVMEKLKEAYAQVNPNAEIEIQLSDSSTGMSMAINGTTDIGMASRQLKESEQEKGLEPIPIALDGIAIIVNNANTIESLTAAQIKSIYTGETLEWNGVIQ